MWDKSRLMQSQTKTVSICGDDVVIRKLKAAEVFGRDIPEKDKTLEMLAASLVEPALSIAEVRELPLEFVNKLTAEILAFNGIGKEANQGN